MRQHQSGHVYPKIYDTLSDKYCIIFGAAMQAEHKFALAVIFVSKNIFLYERKMIMWVEQVKTGFKYIERYTDPMTGKYRRVSIVLEKNSAQARKQAQTALNEKISKALNEHTGSEDLTLAQLIELYRAEQKKTVKASTYSRNYHACETLKKILGHDTLLRNLNAGYIRKTFLATGKENGTLNEHLVRLKALLRWGYRNDYVESVEYLDKLERFADTPHRVKIEDKFLEGEELRDLIAGMKVARWKALTEFIALSGLRFGEAAAVDVKTDIDLKVREIHVTKNYDSVNDVVTTTKTSTSTRDVYMQDELYDLCRSLKAEALALMIGGANPLGLLFPGENGKHIQFYAYNKYLRENSLSVLHRAITPHTLRHTHASLLMEKGVDVDTISARLGHTDSRITRQIYLHVTKRMKEEQNKRMKDIKII